MLIQLVMLFHMHSVIDTHLPTPSTPSPKSMLPTPYLSPCLCPLPPKIFLSPPPPEHCGDVDVNAQLVILLYMHTVIDTHLPTPSTPFHTSTFPTPYLSSSPPMSSFPVRHLWILPNRAPYRGNHPYLSQYPQEAASPICRYQHKLTPDVLHPLEQMLSLPVPARHVQQKLIIIVPTRNKHNIGLCYLFPSKQKPN